MATTRRRRPSIEQSMAIIKGSAGEPLVSKENYKSDLIKALNWYNVNAEEKDIRSYIEYHLKQNNLKDYVYCVSKASLYEIKGIGVIARLLRRDQHVELNEIEKTHRMLDDLKAKYVRPVAQLTAQKRSEQPVLSIQDRIAEAARLHAGEIDGEIDNFAMNKTSEFSMKSYLLSNQVSGAVSKKIGENFKPLLAELNEALLGKCPQLKEAYSYLTKRELRKFAEFVEQIIADCSQQAVSAKVTRKPRARKAKPASVVVKKMAYMKEFAPLKLKSIPPEKIIGASELWVYNTASRKLIVFYGADGGYLGVSGMSITNYDVNKSEVKTLRKPEEFFKGLTSMGKRAMANAWKSVRAKTSSPRARINDEMII